MAAIRHVAVWVLCKQAGRAMDSRQDVLVAAAGWPSKDSRKMRAADSIHQDRRQTHFPFCHWISEISNPIVRAVVQKVSIVGFVH